MKVHIPTKAQIENRLLYLHKKVKEAQRITDVETAVVDELGELECHVYNRAMEERRDST